ncbi:MAG TPA: AzlC family ABC transporter permease [Beijerinckiaceae bacterium]|nr:AzlC family ABC transporter permease [Beijerinckiaceae bacterium]
MSAPVTANGGDLSNSDAAWRGVRDALSLPAWVVGCSLLGVGSLARDAGFPAGAAVLSTVFIWAAPAQAIFFASVAAGTSLPAIGLAICLSSIRFLPMTLAILPLMRRPGQSLVTLIAAAHLVAVTTWVEGLRRMPAMPPPRRLPYFFGFALACIGVSATTTFIGYFLVGALPIPLAAGLLFLTPVFFSVSLVAGARGVGDWTAIVLGFLLAPAGNVVLGKDFDLLAAGLIGGTAAYFAGQWRHKGP